MSITSPTNAEQVRKTIEERVAELKKGDGWKQTTQIEWRDGTEVVPVISMPISLLRYNPETHRIRAQRTLDAEGDKTLNEEPYGVDAQKYLHRLLQGQPSDPSQEDPDFIALKEDLAQHGQAEPGLITRNGVLINGNTRRAALFELGEQNIRVGVLPESASASDIETVELSLQLRKRHQRDYSFMNFLLALDERRKKGWAKEKILEEFRIKPVTYERSVWILDVIRGAIRRSSTTLPDGTVAAMRMIDFETHQGKLEELYRAFVKEKKASTDRADALLEQRLLAIALNHSKTDVRLITPEFSKQYMPDLIPEVSATNDEGTAIPGITAKAPAVSGETVAFRQMTDEVLRLRALGEVKGKLKPEEASKLSADLAQIRTTVKNAVVKADVKAKEKQRRVQASERLGDVNDHLEQTIRAIAEARSSKTFEPDELDEGLLDLRKNLRKLGQEMARSAQEGDDGFQWLTVVGQDV